MHIKLALLLAFLGSSTGCRDSSSSPRPLKSQSFYGDERRIQEAKVKESPKDSGKPAEIIAKIVEGALGKFVGERTLLGQPFIKDDKQTIEKMLAAKKARVNAYAFFVVGEGIEKKTTDFAAEVMATAGKAH